MPDTTMADVEEVLQMELLLQQEQPPTPHLQLLSRQTLLFFRLLYWDSLLCFMPFGLQ